MSKMKVILERLLKKIKKSSTEIMRLLIDKFRVYVGLLSSEAREIATFPELSEKPTIDGDKKIMSA